MKKKSFYMVVVVCDCYDTEDITEVLEAVGPWRRHSADVFAVYTSSTADELHSQLSSINDYTLITRFDPEDCAIAPLIDSDFVNWCKACMYDDSKTVSDNDRPALLKSMYSKEVVCGVEMPPPSLVTHIDSENAWYKIIRSSTPCKDCTFGSCSTSIGRLCTKLLDSDECFQHVDIQVVDGVPYEEMPAVNYCEGCHADLENYPCKYLDACEARKEGKILRKVKLLDK